MPDKKLTDNEIIKALEDLAKCNNNKIDCDNCTLSKFYPRCPEEIGELALDLINRQKAQIEALRKEKNKLMDAQMFLAKTSDEQQAEMERLEHQLETLCLTLKLAKSEARKEFAEKIRKKVYRLLLCAGSVDYCEFDNLLKEMESEKDA